MLLDNILTAVDLDIIYTKGFGDYLVTDKGQEILDIVQGAGTGLFGHNHPEIVATIAATLADKVPHQAQFSIRPSARRVVETFSNLLANSPTAYVGVFTNSGTESTEAALKHALLEHHVRVRPALITRASVERVTASMQTAQKAEVSRETAVELGLDTTGGTADVRAVAAAINHHHSSFVDVTPRFMALRRSFHGKSLGSLRVTFSERYRVPFLNKAETAIFVDPSDPDALETTFRAEMARVYRLEPGSGGRLQVRAENVSRIAGFIYEPIQGEAGIYPVPAETLQRAASLCREHNVPLIADEVQTFARTGELLASHALGIEPDYILLAKGLGGGICKVGVVLIRHERYQAAFSHLHSSTFAGDELSSRVALKILEMITSANGALLDNAHQMGKRLLDQLNALRARHPDTIVDVRGRGLMIGVEFRSLTELPSWALRMVGQTSGCPALDLCAYLLHETGVRTLPTLSQVNTIRIEPPLAIDNATVDRIIAAISRLVEVLSSGDSATFLRHKLRAKSLMPSLALDTSASITVAAVPDCGGRRAAFICHAVEATELRTIDPTLVRLDKTELDRLLRRYENSIAPHILGQTVVRSITGTQAGLVFIGIPYTSARLAEMLLHRDVRSARVKIQQAIDVADQLGCTVCGLGQYSSIVTHNGLAVAHERLALTTGNALTVGTAYAALLRRAQRRGCDVPEARVAVVGAAGNIGAVLAALLSDRFAQIKLIGSGRWGSKMRLQQSAHRVFERASRRWLDRDEDLTRGLAANPLIAGLFKDLALVKGHSSSGQSLYRAALARHGEAIPVTVHDDLAALADCDIIFSAANTSEPIIRVEHLRNTSNAVICDVAVPNNVDARVKDTYPDVELIRGGGVTLPYGEDVQVLGNHLPPGQIFACVAETVLLALEGRSTHFSYGDISCDQVAEIEGVALKHGFGLTDPLPAKDLWARPANEDILRGGSPMELMR